MKSSKLTEIEKAWLACAIDADGTLKCYQKKRNYKGHKIYDGFQMWAILTNTNLRFLNYGRYLLDKFGNTYLQKHRIGRMGHKPVYHVRLCKQASVKELCKEINKYLIIKKKTAIKIIKHKEDKRFKGGFKP